MGWIGEERTLLVLCGHMMGLVKLNVYTSYEPGADPTMRANVSLSPGFCGKRSLGLLGRPEGKCGQEV